jgi:hypothetical protein
VGRFFLACVSNRKFNIGDKVYLNRGNGCPVWLHSFCGYVTRIGKVRYKVTVPVDDDKERWVRATQLSETEPEW